MKKILLGLVLVAVLYFLFVFVFGKSVSEQTSVEVRNEAQETHVDIPPAMPPVQDQSTSDSSASSATLKEFTISGQNFSFNPNKISVKKGDRVRITFNNTSGFHDLVIDGYGLATKQAQAPDTEILEFTADKVGSFEYYCSVGSHRSMGMTGTLMVK